MTRLFFFRLKLILADKLNCFVILFSFVLFLLLMSSLSFGAEERSNVPIGIMDLDRSETSKVLAEKIKKIPAFYVYEEGEKELNRLLLKEEISGIFIIKEGFEDSVNKGSTEKLVMMKYLEGNKSAKVLSDIFAGPMLYPISLAKGLKEYEALKKPALGNEKKEIENSEIQNNWFTGQEYVDYINKLSKASDFDFAFDINMVDLESGEGALNPLGNSVIYFQVVFGILGMLISFVAMYITVGAVVEKEQGLDAKIKITLLKPVYLDLSYILALITVLSGFSVGITFILGRFIDNLTLEKKVTIFVVIFLYAVIMGMWFMVLGRISKKVSRYQILGTLSILLSGVFGFLSMVEGLIKSRLHGITILLPNRWLIEGITDIAFRSSRGYSWFWRLLLLGGVLIIINWFVRKIQNSCWRR
ncbi:ABC transporter permease [Anaerocolumna aminovalerica]|uniref:ABC transporter permease n=1 Tax=Anaerocolumna aminovalerica TaxID=1527 RepID=UPI001C0EE319|nr:ABC transporter permease [Anaerocolumna aminovalerica]MBU5333942.1 ABC transporter permease [Anaerocolumna aminovalerica]